MPGCAGFHESVPRILTFRKRRERQGEKGLSVNIKDMVKDKRVRISFYRDKQLFYKTEDGFELPVPIDDLGNATFLAEDKAILFISWIRKHIDTIEKAKKEQENA
jgi:hypothetical protein